MVSYKPLRVATRDGAGPDGFRGRRRGSCWRFPTFKRSRAARGPTIFELFPFFFLSSLYFCYLYYNNPLLSRAPYSLVAIPRKKAPISVMPEHRLALVFV